MIYLCYGVTKSASTFLYQLTEEILLTSGQTVCRIRQPTRTKLENYYDFITVPFIEQVERAAGGRAVVLKTHGQIKPEVAALIASGRVKASASIRDPREMALSMADNGARARKLGTLPFSEIVEPSDALPSIDMQLDYFAQWAAVPLVDVFTYNEVCFATEVTVRRLCRQLGVEVNVERVLQPFQSGRLIGQINRAIPRRYTEMDSALQALFLQRYGAFYAEVDLKEDMIDTMRAPLQLERGIFSHHVGNTLRLIRRVFLTKNLGIIPSEKC